VISPRTILLLCALAASPVLGADFERIGPFGGDVRSLLQSAHDPAIVYLGTTDGRIYKSLDRGESWTGLYPGIGRRQFVVDTLVEHPTERGHLFAGGWDLRSNGGGLFESLDGGAAWREMSLPTTSPAVRDLAICAAQPDHMIAGALDGVYLSQDGGREWRKVVVRSAGVVDVESVAIDPRDPKIVYAGTWRLGYRSSDFGQTWTRIGEGMLLDSDLFSVAVDPRHPATVYASACSGLYRSTNRGTLWKRLKPLPDRFGVRARIVALDPVNPRRAYAGTTEGLFASDDDGASWRRLTSPYLTVNAVQIDPQDNRRILAGTDDAGVIRSVDGGRTWRESNAGFVQRQISRVLADPARSGRFFTGLLSDGRAGGFYEYEQTGARWEQVTSDLMKKVPEVLSFLELPEERGRLAGTASGLYWQPAVKAPWQKLSGAAGLMIHDLALDSTGAWVVAATSGGPYRAAVAGLDFQRPSPPNSPVLSVASAPGGRFYAGSSIGLLRSDDQGATWRNIATILSERSAAEALALCPAEPAHLFAGTANGLLESRDGGATWYRARDGRLGVHVPGVIFLDRDGKRIAAADNIFGGLFLSEDGGASWQKIEAREYGSPVRSLAADPAIPDVVYLGTSTDGVYRVRLGARPPAAP
jgi:photosystem II stability/assembly factor-like uncharacterized protein